MNRLIEWSCRVYARLLRLLPGDLRADYTGPIIQAFGDLCRAAWRERGLFGLACAWGGALLDLALSVWSEWLARARTRLASMPNASHSAVWAARSGGGLVLVAWRPAQALVLLMLLSVGAVFLVARGANPQPPLLPAPAPAARLLLVGDGWLTPSISAVPVAPIDPTTLANVAGVAPVPTRACSGGMVVSPSGLLAAIVTLDSFAGAPDSNCAGQRRISVSVFDLESWSPRVQIPLNEDDGWAHQLVPTLPGVPPVHWSPDGRRLYVLTIRQPNDLAAAATGNQETRELWIVDPTGAAPPHVVPLDLTPRRLDVSPDGSSLYLLSQQTLGSSRFGAPRPGSTTLLILHATSGSERARVDLPNVVLGKVDTETRPAGAPQWDAGVVPGVALAPDGSRYYVARADAPVLDVVDLRRGSERFERSVQLAGDSGGTGFPPLAAVTVGPDGSRVYVRRNAASPTGAGLRVVDTRTWQVSTFDPVATGVAYSPDGRWLYVQEPRLASRAGAPWTPQRMDVRQADGGRVRVLDAASGDEVANLLQDRLPIQLIAYGTDRLYALVPGPDFPVGHWPLAIQPDDAKARVELIAYEVGTWRELARRPSPFPVLLAGGPSMLGDPVPL